MSEIECQKLCHICQDYVDHFTPNCPKLICAECDEKGHSKRNCPYLVAPEVSKENEELRQETAKKQQRTSAKKVTVQKNAPSYKRTNEEKATSDQLRFRSRKIVGPNDLRYRINWNRKRDARSIINRSFEESKVSKPKSNPKKNDNKAKLQLNFGQIRNPE